MRISVISSLFLLALVTIGGGSLRAEPGPVGKWLMNEPASLWDVGMYRLEEYVHGWKGAHPLASYISRIRYDWDQNRIIIDIFVRKEDFEKEKCASIIKEVRDSGGVGEDGKPFTPCGYSYYSHLFSHLGFKNKDQPENYRQRLDKIFRIKVQFAIGSCEGKLLSNEVLYSD